MNTDSRLREGFLDDSILLARSELLLALAEGHVRLAYQPQVDLETGEILAFEAVARWDHRELGELAPGLFLGLAAREGLLGVLSRTLIGEAARAVATWRAQGYGVDVAVNLAASDITDPSFAGDVATIVARSGARPDWMMLEAGEEGLSFAGEAGFQGLERLQRQGLKIALDAKGPPTVAMDKRARALFSQLKSGGSAMVNVVRRLQRSDASQFVRRLDAARAADLPIVAVGAETAEALRLFAELGFTRAQGNLISPAVRFDACTAFLREHARVEDAGDGAVRAIVTPFADAETESAPVHAETLDVWAEEDADATAGQAPAPAPAPGSASLTLFSLDCLDPEPESDAA
jgi:EAL domain-containing protein (putative c-di-GMP-specific phosphodiesterase class I)